MAKEFEKKLSKLKCEIHPNQQSVLLLIADSTKVIKVDKAGFCCSKFADSVEINID